MSSPREIKMNVSVSRGAYKMDLSWARGWMWLLPCNRQGCGGGRPGLGPGTTPRVEILNHFNSVTTALCKCIQSFITVTAVIATGFRGAVGL